MNKYIDAILSQDYDDDNLIPNKVQAVKMLIKLNDRTYIPDLYEVLDIAEDFWSKELAATVLVELDGVNALERLLVLLLEGKSIGRDNTEVEAIIASLIKNNKAESKSILEDFDTKDEEMSKVVQWALGFV